MNSSNISFLLLIFFYLLNILGIKNLVIAPPMYGLEWWFGIILLSLLVWSILNNGLLVKITIVITLLAWITIQFWVHWRWIFVSVSKAESDWYNRVFGQTIRIFPVNKNHFVPDLYHLILHILLLASVFIFCRDLLHAYKKSIKARKGYYNYL